MKISFAKALLSSPLLQTRSRYSYPYEYDNNNLPDDVREETNLGINGTSALSFCKMGDADCDMD